MTRFYAPSSDAIAAHLDGEAVLLNLQSRRYFRLNETAADVWAALDRGIGEPAAIARILSDRFDVGVAEAEAEVARLLAELEERGLVQVRSV